jgi:ATP-dependent Lon protease
MLHEQLHAIKKELGIVKEDKDALLEKYRKLLKDVQLPEAAKVPHCLEMICWFIRPLESD